jgi:hypothetical protein
MFDVPRVSIRAAIRSSAEFYVPLEAPRSQSALFEPRMMLLKTVTNSEEVLQRYPANGSVKLASL